MLNTEVQTLLAQLGITRPRPDARTPISGESLGHSREYVRQQKLPFRPRIAPIATGATCPPSAAGSALGENSAPTRLLWAVWCRSRSAGGVSLGEVRK